jgi:hypothetical protein
MHKDVPSNLSHRCSPVKPVNRPRGTYKVALSPPWPRLTSRLFDKRDGLMPVIPLIREYTGYWTCQDT